VTPAALIGLDVVLHRQRRNIRHSAEILSPRG